MNRTRRYIYACGLCLLLTACAGEAPQNLGATSGRLATCPTSPNCVSSQAQDEPHRIAPLQFTGAAETAMTRLRRVLEQRPDARLVDARSDYLRVELHTTLFIDDAEFLLDREQGVIQLRSASRVGYSDLGKNRSRMEEIRADFAAAGATP